MDKALINDIEIKENKIREFLVERGLSGVIFSTQTNFLWFTCGKRNEVLKTADTSLVYLFITRDKKYLISSISDIDRVMREELEGLGFEPVEYRWYDGSPLDAARKIKPEGKIGADFFDSGVENVEDGLMALRIDLTAFEVEKVRKFSKQYSMLLTDFCSTLKPGISERKLANDFTYSCSAHGIRVPVTLVGSDERIYKYRHPAATDKKIDKYILFATVAEKDGLNISITRSVYFGDIPKDIIKRQEAVNYVEAVYCSNSKPGVSLKEVFQAGKKAYKDAGYADEWKNHTQGGVIGYKPREIVATDLSDYKLKNNNLLSWNPTVAGAKAEDIYVIDGEKTQQLSIDERWPYMEISVGNMKFKKPKIMEL
jgi:Xaa-Pro dipeptidase